jgi:purine-binding chemotaxis protein CheW
MSDSKRNAGAAGTLVETQNARRAHSDEQEQLERIDYKMVTFSLGGKDYGIDIMKVKEIAKYHHFTYVPNTPPFVRGVYNLRGDIISVIDLRLMFNLPAEQRESGKPENGLILRLESNLIGVIVDKIDRVVGISSESIQPPHPIFADINIKYISGVVEHEDRLYIILDVERIFSKDEEGEVEKSMDIETEAETAADSSAASSSEAEPEDVSLGFIEETLETFKGFYVSELNRTWIRDRFEQWKRDRRSSGRDVQLKDIDDADEYMRGFFSQHTADFWRGPYRDAFRSVLPDPSSTLFSVWNPGCGKGYESYSIAGILRKAFPEASIKVWASDKDLLSISTAPNLMFEQSAVPEDLSDFVVSSKNGHSFSEEIKDLIAFEYHDLANPSSLPDMDLIVARDVLSFMPTAEQERILGVMHERCKPGGVLILGTNEEALGGGWEAIGNEHISAYRRV